MGSPSASIVLVRELVFVILAATTASQAAVLSAITGPTGPRAGHFAVVDGCGEADRWCLAYPDNCSTDRSCTTVVTVRKDPTSADKYLFEMSAKYTGYVSVALAESTQMGEDSVVECINDPTKNDVLVYQSVNKALNPLTKKRGNTRLPTEEQNGVSLVTKSLADGVITCSFQRDRVTTVRGKQYDLAVGSWVLQAASGNRINNNTSVYHHLEWVVSPEKVKISEPSGLIKYSYGSRRESITPSSTDETNKAPPSFRAAAFTSLFFVVLTLYA